MKWNSSADQHLLLAILSAHRLNVDYNRVAQIVGCTPRACEERIKKLRKLAKECGYGTSLSLSSGKKGRKNNKGGKDGGRKGKCIDNEDMILYRNGIVSDDIEVKMEDGLRIKGEVIKTEFEMSHYGYGYGYENNKPLIKQQQMEDPSPFTADPGIEKYTVSSTQYADTAADLRFPFGVRLEEIYSESLASRCPREGREGRRGEVFDLKNRGAVPLKKEFSRPLNYQHLTSKTRSPKIERSAQSPGLVEFVEISPASKKDPIVINDDNFDGVCP